MTYTVYIGDQTFSSWSLRGWLLFEKFDLPYQVQMIGLYGGTMAEDMAPLAPARLVPAVKTPEGTVIGETLAIAEELNTRHPEAQMWPEDPAARAYARWIVSEMHAGFGGIRGECPMQLLHQFQGFVVSDAVKRDVARIEELLCKARAEFGAEGPWLFGRYSIADAFYAPVAARIAGYGLDVSPTIQAYVDTTLQDAAFKAWRAEGLKKTYDPVPYALDLPVSDWPGPD